MASEKQIAANRANAMRSTGPKTAAGKLKSSRNAYRHGLSAPVLPDPASLAKVNLIALGLAGEQASEDRLTSAEDFAHAQAGLFRIRSIRTERLAKMNLIDSNYDDIQELKRLAALDRYERYALTRRRRALKNLQPEG